jgi:hypothetical protein
MDLQTFESEVERGGMDEQQSKHTKGSHVSTQKMIESFAQPIVFVRRENA